MEEYKINSDKSNLYITINLKDKNIYDLIASFSGCKDGNCSCPSNEYKKLKNMRIERMENSIKIILEQKDGETISKSEIENCILYTLDSLK
ncbi:MAG: hypothetical protein KDK36_21505 [Leptospiraceae bacterium]|nr:hypothetical protein [Leptospiraceae bacterium]